MRRALVPAAVLLAAMNVLVITRLALGDVKLSAMYPRVQYRFTLSAEMDLVGDPAKARIFVPHTDEHQTIASERVEAPGLTHTVTSEGPNRRVVLEAQGQTGHEIAVYSATVEVTPTHYRLPEAAAIPEEYPREIIRFLQPTEAVQSDAPEIRDKAQELVAGVPGRNITGTIRALFDFVHDDIRGSDYESTLDALLTLRWGEAFCGGKSRLLAALLRASGIPARLVGGIILKPGSKRITHVWLEAWVNGVWVPFDALNDHFAERPATYLVLYEGDHALVSRTANMNFQYIFKVKKWRTPPEESLAHAGVPSFLNAYQFWNVFRKADISLNLLRILLILPLGVLVVVLSRNVIGLTTFGTFLPALIAVAFRDTGLLWGIALFLGVLVVGGAVRVLLERLELLHTPRLAVVLTAVVAFILAISYVSVRAGELAPAHMGMFPIAILAITVENFFTKVQEEGVRRTLGITVSTLLVVSAIFVIIESDLVQAVTFVFPEVLLGVVATYLVLGRWMGIRLLELRRFRWLLVD